MDKSSGPNSWYVTVVAILILLFSGVKGLARHGLFYAAIKFRISAIILIDVDHN